MKVDNIYYHIAYNIINDLFNEINESKLKVHPIDDRMMEDGTINPNHYTLKNEYQSESDFNDRQRASKFN